MDDRPISTEQVEEIIARALELERAGPMLGEEDLRAIAQEINVSPQAIEQATREVLARSDHPRAPAGGGSLARLAEVIGAIAAGVFAGGLASAGFPILAVMLVLLVGVGLASRSDWRSIARLMAEWVLLCGVFGFVASLLVGGIAPTGLAALFAGGGLLAAGIVWLQERQGMALPDSDPPLLASESEERP